jgi:hypothetical protein
LERKSWKVFPTIDDLFSNGILEENLRRKNSQLKKRVCWSERVVYDCDPLWGEREQKRQTERERERERARERESEQGFDPRPFSVKC